MSQRSSKKKRSADVNAQARAVIDDLQKLLLQNRQQVSPPQARSVHEPPGPAECAARGPAGARTRAHTHTRGHARMRTHAHRPSAP